MAFSQGSSDICFFSCSTKGRIATIEIIYRSRGRATMRGFLLALSMTSVANALTIGDPFPKVSIDYGFPPKVVPLKERLTGKKILVGLPGAFTPT